MEESKTRAATETIAFGSLLLDIGMSLLQAGANNSRIKTAMSELSAIYNYSPQITIGPGSVSLVLYDKGGIKQFNDVRTSAAHGINFSIVAGMSRLSRFAEEKGWSVAELKEAYTQSKAAGDYPRLVILLFVSLAGAAFCFTFGGGPAEMAITFGATFCGLFVKQQLTKIHVNPYFCTYAAALMASLFTGVFAISGLMAAPAIAFSTCVLFLIPGVLLINSFTDLIDGHTMNGIVRGVNALIHILAIALGLVTTILTLNLKG